MLNPEEMKQFIQSLFILHKGKSTKNGNEDGFSTQSIPLKSMANDNVFYEFTLIKNINKTVIAATVTLCHQTQTEMKRLEMIYANGYVVQGNWLNDLELIIACQQEKIGDIRRKKLINILVSNGLVEEPYVNEPELMKLLNSLLPVTA